MQLGLNEGAGLLVAEWLSIAVRTVENHLQRAYDALGARNRSEFGPLLAAASRSPPAEWLTADWAIPTALRTTPAAASVAGSVMTVSPTSTRQRSRTSVSRLLLADLEPVR